MSDRPPTSVLLPTMRWTDTCTELAAQLRDGDNVYHTYSTYGRGTEQVGGTNYFRDLTVLGRQEVWEEPAGRTTGLGAQAGSDGIRYPNEYHEDAGKESSFVDADGWEKLS